MIRREGAPFGRLLAGLALLGVAGALPAPAQLGFSETAEVVAIEVPVQVVLDGQPVRGLTADNFEIYEGRKKQPVTAFEVLDLSAPATFEKGAVPASARRHFLLLFDLSFAEPRSVVQARKAVTEMVLEDLHPTDLVAVATYRLSKGPQLALGFTPDREQVRRAVATLGVPELIDRTPDPLRMVAAEFRENLDKQGSRGPVRDFLDGLMLEQLEDLAREEGLVNRQVSGAQVAALSRSLSDLAKLMNSVSGRKHVVYLSEGFDSSLLLGTADQEETRRMNAAAASGVIQNVQSDARFGSTEAVNDVERLLEELRRADCVVQAVDIGGLRGQGDQGATRPAGRDTLFNLARSTGGELYENYNDLGEAMGQMLQRTGVTYVLTFQPDDIRFDGAYHRLRVELKNAPRGARVVARPGYYAPRPYAQRSAFEKALDAGNLVLGEDAGDGGGVRTAVLTAPFQLQPDAKAYVPVVIEVNGPSLLAGQQGTALPAEIYAYAFDARGAVHDFFTQTVSLDIAKVEGQLLHSGLKFFGHLELPPGDYDVRVLVRNGVTGRSGLRVVPVRVPAAQASGPVLLPPFFPDPPGKWLMVREAPRGEQQQAPYPFTRKQQPYVPASLPVLAPGQEAQVALIGYNLGTGDLKLAARVLTPDGKEVAPGDLKVVEREDGTAPDRLTATFRTPQQPGEYRLVVTLTGATGSSETGAPFVVAAARRGARG